MNVLEELLEDRDIEITKYTISLECRNCRRTWGVKTYTLESLLNSPDLFICVRCKKGERRNEQDNRSLR